MKTSRKGENDDPLTYRVVGGPGDGKRVLKVALPIEDGGRKQIITPHEPDTALLYERRGDDLHFIEQYEIVVFEGGPLDGTTDTLVHCEAQGISEGEHAVIPVEPGRYAWYRRDGRRLRFSHYNTESEIKPLLDNDEPEPGLRIT